jgi:hypothetical protein
MIRPIEVEYGVEEACDMNGRGDVKKIRTMLWAHLKTPIFRCALFMPTLRGGVLNPSLIIRPNFGYSYGYYQVPYSICG